MCRAQRCCLGKLNITFFKDQNLVPKSSDEVEAEVHERPGAGCSAVLLHPRHPRSQANVHRRQTVVSTGTHSHWNFDINTLTLEYVTER